MDRTDQVQAMIVAAALVLTAVSVLTCFTFVLFKFVMPLARAAYYHTRAQWLLRSTRKIHFDIKKLHVEFTPEPPRYRLTEGHWFYRPGHGDTYQCRAPVHIDRSLLGQEVYIDERVHEVEGIEYLPGPRHYASPGEIVCITVKRRARTKES